MSNNYSLETTYCSSLYQIHVWFCMRIALQPKNMKIHLFNFIDKVFGYQT